jgi:hypothetical protein
VSEGLRHWLWRFLVLEALIWLLAANASIRLAPFRHLASLLGVAKGDAEEAALSSAPDCRRLARAQRVGQAVGRAARLSPWPARCLAQAMAAKAMLACRGTASRLHLGVKASAGADLEAHAWLTLDGAIIIGGAIRQEYTELARFG